jgi:acyl carrier protein
MNDKIMQQVSSALGSTLGLEQTSIFRSSRIIEDLRCEHPVVIVGAIEQEFEIIIFDEDLELLKTVEHIAALVEERLKQSGRLGEFA